MATPAAAGLACGLAVEGIDDLGLGLLWAACCLPLATPGLALLCLAATTLERNDGSNRCCTCEVMATGSRQALGVRDAAGVSLAHLVPQPSCHLPPKVGVGAGG